MNFSTSTLDFSILPYQEGVNPPVTKPNPAFLTDIGEESMRDLLDKFYMGLFKSPIKDIFPSDKEEMKIAGQHSADFFIQICGENTLTKTEVHLKCEEDTPLFTLRLMQDYTGLSLLKRHFSPL